MPFSIEQSVRWGDLDALQHVNNTMFFRWFEDVRIAAFDAVGIDRSGPSDEGPILATTTATFERPVHYPATVVVSCSIPRVGRTSFVMDYAVHVDGHRVATGQGVVVLVDYATGEKVPVSEALRERLLGL